MLFLLDSLELAASYQECAHLAYGPHALPRFNAHLSRGRDPEAAYVRARRTYCDSTSVMLLAVAFVHGIPTIFPHGSLCLEGSGSLSLGQAERHVYRHSEWNQEEQEVAP